MLNGGQPELYLHSFKELLLFFFSTIMYSHAFVLVLFGVLAIAWASPVPGYDHHKHVVIHVPYKVHTVHHHHVKKVPYPVHHVEKVHVPVPVHHVEKVHVPVPYPVVEKVHVPVIEKVHVPVPVHEEKHGWEDKGGWGGWL